MNNIKYSVRNLDARYTVGLEDSLMEGVPSRWVVRFNGERIGSAGSKTGADVVARIHAKKTKQK